MKRFISLLLAFLMVIQLVPASQAVTLAPPSVTVQRDIVLMLDISDSMEGEPFDTMKTAAVKFCEQLLETEDDNRIALVVWDYNYTTYDFSGDINAVKDIIYDIELGGGTNTAQALAAAEELMDYSSRTGAIKNIVLLTDGIPQHGETTSNGPYEYEDSTYYEYANSAYNVAASITSKYSLYALGFFHNLWGEKLEFAKRFLKDIQNAGYYEVSDPEELEFVFGDIVEDITAKPHPFRFAGHLTTDSEATCYYSDGYFNRDASDYNSHLATMSLCFELSTWSRVTGSEGWTTNIEEHDKAAWKNAYDLLVTELEFHDFAVNEFWENEPTKDSIGAVAATKELANNGGTLIALGVRGGRYAQEWASNFTVGKTGEHDGFAEAKNNVLEFLTQYISDHNITGEIKIWVVGYSRGGCVANMVAGEINNGYYLGNVTVPHENLFAYTFEAPQGTTKSNASGDHSNIHNIINLNDLVPLVAPSSWGFARYNTDYWLPTAATSSNFDSQLSNMLKHYNSFAGHGDYNIEEYGYHYSLVIDWWKFLPGGDPLFSIKSTAVPTQRILTDSAAFVFDGVIGDRDTYYSDFQAGVRELFALLNGGSLGDLLEDGMTVDEFISKFFSQLTIERIIDIVSPMVALNLDSFEERKEKVADRLKDFVKEVLNDSDLWGTVVFVADLGDTLTDTLWRLFETVLEDLFNKDTKSLQSLINLFVMLAKGGIGQAHFPEITLAWLMSQDSFYQEGQTDFSIYNSYRIIRINCPVDVNVYRTDTNQLVASIVDDVPQDVAGSSIYAYMNADGEKIVILPSDADYNIDITATGDGTLSYTINEYSLESQAATRIIHYNDIAITEGDVLNADVPAFEPYELAASIPGGSSADYSLREKEGSEIPPDEDISGTEAKNAVYTVSAARNNSFGSVAGGGRYSLGSYAKVTATPLAGSTFQGWYRDGEKVSDDPSYRFVVTGDTTVVAHFAEVENYTLIVTSTEGGTVSNETLCIPAGVQVQLEATADENYTFTSWNAENGKFENPTDTVTWFTMPACDVTVTASFSSGSGGPGFTVPENNLPELSPTGGDYTPSKDIDDFGMFLLSMTIIGFKSLLANYGLVS